MTLYAILAAGHGALAGYSLARGWLTGAATNTLAAVVWVANVAGALPQW